MDKFEILKTTEALIQSLHTPPRGTRPGALGLWKTLSDEHARSSGLALVEVGSEAAFESLAALRAGFTEPQEVGDSLSFLYRCQDELGAKAFLLKDKDTYVGEIGIVPFSFDLLRVGRLQDVEIAPHYQGKGYGNQLLALTFLKAKEMGLSALCLKARPNDWTPSWYERHGFFKVGTW